MEIYKNPNLIRFYNGEPVLEKKVSQLNEFYDNYKYWGYMYEIYIIDNEDVIKNISESNLYDYPGIALENRINSEIMNIIINDNKAILESHKYQYHIKNKTNHAKYDYHELDKIDINKNIKYKGSDE